MSGIHNRGEVSSLLIILSSTFLVYTYRKCYDPSIDEALYGFLAMGIAALSGSGSESNSSCHGNGGITM